MLTHSEIKAIMAEVFKKEHSKITEDDIRVALINSHVVIQIKGYEHITYKLFPEKVECEFFKPFMVRTFEYMCFSKHPEDKLSIGCCDSDTDYPFTEALAELAYYISRDIHYNVIAPYKEIRK